jgi:NADH:ubiquinone oxidoreductase subunit 5 (subunit L)/multisubunit Na+/H+ antiporter MnhA subunit
MGLFNNMAFNLIILFLSIKNLTFTSSLTDFNWVFQYIILSIGFFALLWEAFLPILDHNPSKLNLQEISNWAKKYPSFIFLLLFGIFYLIGPGFPGFSYLQQIMEHTIIRNMNYPLISAILWFILLLFILGIVSIVIFTSTLLVHVFFKQNNPLSEEELKSSRSGISYMISPLLLMIGMILLFVSPVSIEHIGNLIK